VALHPIRTTATPRSLIHLPQVILLSKVMAHPDQHTGVDMGRRLHNRRLMLTTIHRPNHKEVTGMDPLHLSNQTAIQVLGLECQLRTAILTLKGTHTLLDLHPQLLSPSAVGHPPDIASNTVTAEAVEKPF
jgi:hypothetical protein